MVERDTTDDLPSTIFKIEEGDAWRAAERAGRYAGSALDLADGFIHLSAAHQVRGTLERYYAGVGNLVLVAVDRAAVGDALRWEVSRAGERFPHLYGDLVMSAVIGVRPIAADGDVSALQDWGI